MLTESEKKELEELKKDKTVKAAKKKLYDKDKQYLYRLRWLKKKAAEMGLKG